MATMKLFTFICCFLLLSCQVFGNSPMLITSPSICLDDTECSSDDYCNLINNSCTKRAGLRGKCRFFAQSSCKTGLYCDYDDTCKRIIQLGGICGSDDACGPMGVCDFTGGSGFGKCVSTGPLKSFYGRSCESLHDCATLANDTPRPPVTSPVDCVTGVCRDPRNLKKTNGEPCNRKNDLCDGRRGLVCKFNRYARRSVCQQKVTTEAVANRFCTIGSQYSMCAPKFGFPNSCTLNMLSGFTDCGNKPDLSSRGQLCGTNGAANGKCRPGLSCEFNPEVLSKRYRPYFSCVKLVGEGEACPESTTTKCGPGLFCDARVCRKGILKTPFIKYNGEYIRCGHRDCASGLECDFSVRQCLKPVKVVKKGRECFDSTHVRRVCADGLTCKISPKTALLTCL